jgi:NhaC family Na+:H+ antiporter
LARLIEPLRRWAHNDRKAMLSVGGTAIGINTVAADQYLAIVLTGNVYKEEFRKRGIAPQSLSRQVEDTATVTSVLIPWNSCGAYAAGVLGVATMAYLPFAFFNWINPIVSFIYDTMGWQIHKVQPGQEYAETPEQVEFYGVEEPYGRATPDEG